MSLAAGDDFLRYKGLCFLDQIKRKDMIFCNYDDH